MNHTVFLSLRVEFRKAKMVSTCRKEYWRRVSHTERKLQISTEKYPKYLAEYTYGNE